jgi:Fic family protein
MQRDAFTKDAPGRLVASLDGHLTFVPDPLPPGLAFDTATIKLLSDADQAMGQLAGVGRMLPNPHLLIRPFLRREAVLSSKIEGTQTSLEQLLLFEVDPEEENKTPDVREVSNYVAALEYGIKRLKTLPVSLRLIREVHEHLLRGVRGEDHRPGEFRQRQVYIGRSNQPIEASRFVPPGASELNRLLKEFEQFLNAPSDLPVLIQLALIHYQFETIHPFLDGNGRVGRLLITLLLCDRDCLPQPLLYLSAYLEEHRDAYMDHLLRVSQTGDWMPWIRFFLQGVAEQSRDAINRSRAMLDLWQEYRRRIQSTKAPARALHLVDELFASPVLTSKRAREILGVTFRSAQQNIDKLVAAHILREATGKPKNRIYLATGILERIEGVTIKAGKRNALKRRVR